MTEHDDLAGRPKPTGCFHLFRSAQFNEFFGVLVGVPGSFGTVGQNEMVDDATCGGPFGKSAATLKFSIVRMGDDDESARWSWKVTRSHRSVWKVSDGEGW